MNYSDINSHSWFDIKKATFKNHTINSNIIQSFPEKIIKCEKVILNFTDIQKNIILDWMKACEMFYNEVIKYFKKNEFNKSKPVTNFIKLRKLLKDNKEKYVKKYNIPVHILDCAIKRACSNLQSCLSNMKNNNIKHFRLRYLKESNPNKIIEIEQGFFSDKKNTFCSSYLGSEINSNNFDLKKIKTEFKSDCKLHYNKKNKRFTLLVPKKINTKDNNNQYTISIDPGIRTFLTGISDNHIIKIGNNMSYKIGIYLLKNDNLKGDIKNGKIKKRYEKINNKKIKNLITDLQWKTINFLTSHYKTIYIGKWSTKKISNNDTSNLSGFVKRIASRLRFYEFLEKLRYKCIEKRINIIIKSEAYTSKMCSNCGWENENLNCKKIFECENCNKEIDRDINGARNIYIKNQ